MEVRVRFLFVADDERGNAVHALLLRESPSRGRLQRASRWGCGGHELGDVGSNGRFCGDLFAGGIAERLDGPALFAARGMLRERRQRREQPEEQGSGERFSHHSSFAATRARPPAASNAQLFESHDVRLAPTPSGFVPVSCWICAANCAALVASPSACAFARPAWAAATAAAVLAG